MGQQKRSKPMRNVNLFDDQVREIDYALVEIEGVNRSEVIRAAIDEFIARDGLERQPWDAYDDGLPSRVPPWEADPEEIGALEGFDLTTDGDLAAVANGAAEPAVGGPDGQAEGTDNGDEARKAQLVRQLGIGPMTAKRLVAQGYETPQDLVDAEREELQEVDGIGEQRAKRVLDAVDDVVDAPEQ